MTRAFSSLNPQEALHCAIFIEERNAGIYQRYAEMFNEFGDVDSLEIANVFWDMSVEEKHHSSQLQAKYRERYGDQACSMTDDDLREMIEVPKLESGDIFEAVESVIAGPRQRALKVALEAERGARIFYAELSEHTNDAALRQLYRELSVMEDGHVSYLQGLLAETYAAKQPAEEIQ